MPVCEQSTLVGVMICAPAGTFPGDAEAGALDIVLIEYQVINHNFLGFLEFLTF